jgi:hypothetical protein
LGASAIIHFIAIALSGTRSAIAGTVIGVAYLVVRARHWNDRSNLRTGIAMLLILVAGCGGFLTWNGSQSFRQRLAQWVEDYRGGPRLLVWRDSLALVAKSALIGTGPDTYMREFPRVESEELARLYPNITFESPHNVFLDYLTTEGIAGLGSFLGLLALAFVSSERRRRHDPALQTTMQAALIGIVIWMCFTNLTVPNSLYLTVLIALMAAPVGDDIPQNAKDASARDRALLAVPALAALLAACLYALNDSSFTRARDLLSQGDVRSSQQVYEAAVRIPFPRSSRDLWYSHLLAQSAVRSDHDSAASAWRLAASASARAEAYSDEPAAACYQSALLLIPAGEVAQAEKKLRESIGFAPSWYRPHLFLAQILKLTGRAAEGEQQGQIALRTAGAFEPRVREALAHPEHGPV